MKWNTSKDITKDVMSDFKIYEEKIITINGCNHHVIIFRSEPVLFHTFTRYFIGFIQVGYTTNLEKISETDISVCYIYDDYDSVTKAIEIKENSNIEWVFLSELLSLGGLNYVEC